MKSFKTSPSPHQSTKYCLCSENLFSSIILLSDDLLSLQVGPSLKSALDSRGVSFDGPRQEQELNAFLLYGFGGAVA